MDIQTVQDVLMRIAIFAPITTGLVQVVKVSGVVPAQFLPLVAVILGGVFGFFFVLPSLLGVLGGIALGLAAVGLFEIGRTTVLGK